MFHRERLKFSRRAVADDNEEIDDYLKVYFNLKNIYILFLVRRE